MNINTPLFRGALSLVVIWLIVWAYLSFQSFQTGYRDPLGITVAADPEVTAECYSAKPDFSRADFKLKEPTAQEQAECVDRSLQNYRQLTQSSNEWLAWHSSEEFLKIGLLPAVGLLIVIAFWTTLAGAGVAIARRYANWLRNGKNGIADGDS